MPRKNRKEAAPVDPTTLYSAEPLSDAELEILHDAELLIRRWKLRLKILPKEQLPWWTWNCFIESLGAAKASIGLGAAPCFESNLSPSEEARWSQLVADYQKARGSSPIEYSAVLFAIDNLIGNGTSTKDILLRLQGDSARPRARYAESWEVENSGLFDVKATLERRA
jgi:hypothetical protein